MNEPQSLSAIEFGISHIKLGRSYLLTGGEAYLVDKVLDAIRNRLKKTDNTDLFIIYGDDVKSTELTEQLDTFSIFSAAKLILIRGAEKLGKKEMEVLMDYFSAPSDIQSLIIVAEKIDARLSSWKAIKANCLHVLCEPPRYGGAIRAWLEAELKFFGKSMTSKAIEEFINRIELDYYNAANELAKLDIITHDRQQISELDVLTSLGTSRTGTLIDFYRALGRRQAAQALHAMEKMLLADWKPLQVFFQINSFYQNIWRILVFRKAHLSDSEIIAKHMNDVYQTQRKEFVEFAHHYTLSSVQKVFNILLETDSQLKLSAAEPIILLGSCLLRVISA